MATIFPDVEKLLVARLKSNFESSSESFASNVTVATKKPAAEVSPYPTRIVTVRTDGGLGLERGLTKTERIGVNVYAATYSDASNLARLVEAWMRTFTSGDIKRVETTMSPVRVDNNAKEEQRYMTFELVVKASSL
jgi:hypothetical protein